MTELGDFLRARRAQLAPAEAGLATYGDRRRVPGLRREELAQLAGVSVTYYTRLEQGQNRNASEAVLDALARALRLDPDEADHLHELARPPAPSRRTPRPETVRPGVRLLLDSVGAVPAVVLGRRVDVLAWNRLGHLLHADDLDFGVTERCAERPNMARRIVLEPRSRTVCGDWERKVEDVAAYLRLAAGQYPDDQQLTMLVGELCMKSDLFAQIWARHPVRDCADAVRTYHHPLVGDLVLHEEPLRLPGDPGQRIMISSPEPDSASAERLALLASLAVTSSVLRHDAGDAAC